MRSFFAAGIILYANFAFGAQDESAKASQEASDYRPVVFYVDGAGGGSLLTNWAPPVREGLEKGNYQGEFRQFIWQTGLGVLADQTASVSYKCSKAKKLADQIVACKNTAPQRPIIMIGLSAGTVIILYTLENLPEGCCVDRVILIGSSVNANYDLRQALPHVNDDLIVYTSERDEILTGFVPMTGSADRKYVGTDVAGIQGFHIPGDADEMTQTLYKKVKTIPWQTEFEAVGDNGGHVDKTNPRFVAKYLTPLVLSAGKSPDLTKLASLLAMAI
jgi:hypothetical protein